MHVAKYLGMCCGIDEWESRSRTGGECGEFNGQVEAQRVFVLVSQVFLSPHLHSTLPRLLPLSCLEQPRFHGYAASRHARSPLLCCTSLD